MPEDVESSTAEDRVNAHVFEERHRLAWPEVLADADRACQAMLAQAEACSAEELFGSQYGPAMQMDTAGQRLGVAGCWHIFEHETQFYVERSNLARASEVQKAAVDARMALVTGPRDRAVALYNLACFYATTGQPQEALARLPEALRLLPDLAEYAQQDSDLDLLRDEPAYRALFEKQ